MKGNQRKSEGKNTTIAPSCYILMFPVFPKEKTQFKSITQFIQGGVIENDSYEQATERTRSHTNCKKEDIEGVYIL